MGLPPPIGYATGNVVSVAVEPQTKTAQLRVRFRDNENTSKQLILIAETNAASQITWRCSSPDMAAAERAESACQ